MRQLAKYGKPGVLPKTILDKERNLRYGFVRAFENFAVYRNRRNYKIMVFGLNSLDCLPWLKPDATGCINMGKFMGKGCTRVVFQDPVYPSRVIKLSQDTRSCNLKELRVYSQANSWQRSILARVYKVTQHGFMSSQQRVEGTLCSSGKDEGEFSNYRYCYKTRRAMGIGDMHDENIGYIGKKLKLIDFAWV